MTTTIPNDEPRNRGRMTDDEQAPNECPKPSRGYVATYRAVRVGRTRSSYKAVVRTPNGATSTVDRRGYDTKGEAIAAAQRHIDLWIEK